MLLGIIVGILPFFDGLFFATAKDLVSGGILFLGVLMLWLYSRRDSIWGWVDLAMAIYVAMALFGVFYGADPSLATQGAWIGMADLAIYGMAKRLAGDNPEWVTPVWVVLGLTGVVLGVVGVANAWHQLSFPSAYSATNHAVSLASVFQYHNTFAAFEGAIGLGLWAYLARMDAGSPWLRYGLAAVIGWTLTMVILSDSRGEWLVASIVTLIVLWRVADFRWQYAGTGLLIGAGALPGLWLLHHGMVQADDVWGWAGVLSTLLGSALGYGLWGRLGSFLINAMARVPSRRVGRWIGVLVGVFLVVGIIVKRATVLHAIGTRSLTQVSVPQRLLLWHDGFRLFLMSPLWGWGSGGWHDLYFRVRSQPYFINEVHSFLLQTAIDKGIVGAIAVLGLAWYLWRTTGNVTFDNWMTQGGAWALAVFGLGLWIHGLGDWDFSFLYIQLLWFGAVGWVSGVFGVQKTWVLASRGMQWFLRGIVTLVGLITITGAVANAESLTLLRKADALPPGPVQVAWLEKAHELAPYSASTLVQLATAQVDDASTRHQNGVTVYQNTLPEFEAAARMNRWNSSIEESAAVAADRVGQWALGYAYAQQGYEDLPLSGYTVSQLANAAAPYALSIARIHPNAARRVAIRTLATLNRWQSLSNPGGALSGFARDSAAALLLLDDRRQQARQWLEPALTSQTALTRDLAGLLLLLAQPSSQNLTVRIDRYIQLHPDVVPSYSLLRLALIPKPG
ncbi:O-antigen polymerase [Sulfobacillus acidophilus TPY]|nr:O-antigen polymerase [Sulfobacillus acidophilus TPY]